MDPLTYLAEMMLSLIAELGSYGVLFGMILESSVIPIPSEPILVTAGLAVIDPLSIEEKDKHYFEVFQSV